MIVRLLLACVLWSGLSTAASGRVDVRLCETPASDARHAVKACTLLLNRAALTDRERAATHVNRGVALARSGKPDAAIADYDAALALVPGFPEALVDKGIAFVNAGRSREAVELLTEGIAGEPSQPEIAYYTRGLANEDIGATRDAYSDYVAAQALAPKWTKPAEELKRFSVVRRRTAVG